MMRRIMTVVALLAVSTTLAAQHWPAFRGPNATGVADGQPTAVKWNAATGENVLWKTPIPGVAVSSPIVWGDRVFVSTAVSSDPKPASAPGQYGDVEPVTDATQARLAAGRARQDDRQGRLGPRRLRGHPEDQASSEVEPGVGRRR